MTNSHGCRIYSSARIHYDDERSLLNIRDLMFLLNPIMAVVGHEVLSKFYTPSISMILETLRFILQYSQFIIEHVALKHIYCKIINTLIANAHVYLYYTDKGFSFHIKCTRIHNYFNMILFTWNSAFAIITYINCLMTLFNSVRYLQKKRINFQITINLDKTNGKTLYQVALLI